jgi:hypothetical protein
LILYPNPSFTNHIKSEEATNANINILPPMCHIKPSLNTIDVIEIPRVVEAFKKGNRGVGNYFGNYKMAYRISKLKKKVLSNVNRCSRLLWEKN